MMLNHHDECLLWSVVDRGIIIVFYYLVVFDLLCEERACFTSLRILLAHVWDVASRRSH
jgi:hypothetical protein